MFDFLKDFRGKVNQVKSVRYTSQSDKLLLVPFGDIHLGSPQCDIDKLIGTVEFIQRADCVVVLMGDMIEFATAGSVGAGWSEQVTNPQKQLDAIVQLLQPIKHKVLVALEGNHEARARKSAGLDVAKIMADQLGVPYGGYSSFVYLQVGKESYTIHAQHGNSGARYLRTKLASAMKTAEHTYADVYLYGHTHELAVATQPYRVYDRRMKGVRERKQYFVLTGGFLNYYGGYAEQANLSPTRTGVANIVFSGNRWDVHVKA